MEPTDVLIKLLTSVLIALLTRLLTWLSTGNGGANPLHGNGNGSCPQ